MRPELDSRDEELAKAKKGGERQREGRQGREAQRRGAGRAAELRTALEESKSECEGLRAMAESARLSAPAVRDTPKESLVPMSEQGGGQTAFGKYQRKITELEAECSSLRSQLAGMANSSPRAECWHQGSGDPQRQRQRVASHPAPTRASARSTLCILYASTSVSYTVLHILRPGRPPLYVFALIQTTCCCILVEMK